MSSQKISLYKALCVVFFVWAIITTALACKYYMDVQSLNQKVYYLEQKCNSLQSSLNEVYKKLITVNLAIDYGNGTQVWYNGTLLPKGSTLFVATAVVAKSVKYKLGAYGVYITSINGVSEKIIKPGKEGYSWIWYYYDPVAKKWKWGPTAADKYVLKDGEIVMWKYTHWKY